MILSGTTHKLHGVYTLILIQSFILKLMFAFNKIVSRFALATSNKITLKVKKNCCFFFWGGGRVFATKRGGNSISCTQIVEASSREHVSIQVPQQYYHFWP